MPDTFIEPNTTAGTGAGAPKSSLKKPIIITVAIIVVMIIAAVIILAVVPKQTGDQGKAEQGQSEAEIRKKDYTTTMKLFADIIGKEIVVDDLQEQAKKVDENFLISDNEKPTGRLYLPEANDYIEFTIFNEEDDSPDTAIDFIYNYPANEEIGYVMQSGEKTYQNFNGAITNEFDNVDDALADSLLFH